MTNFEDMYSKHLKPQARMNLSKLTIVVLSSLMFLSSCAKEPAQPVPPIDEIDGLSEDDKKALEESKMELPEDPGAYPDYEKPHGSY